MGVIHYNYVVLDLCAQYHLHKISGWFNCGKTQLNLPIYKRENAV